MSLARLRVVSGAFGSRQRLIETWFGHGGDHSSSSRLARNRALRQGQERTALFALVLVAWISQCLRTTRRGVAKEKEYPASLVDRGLSYPLSVESVTLENRPIDPLGNVSCRKADMTSTSEAVFLTSRRQIQPLSKPKFHPVNRRPDRSLRERGICSLHCYAYRFGNTRRRADSR
jgi:hypothetical protein